MLLCPAGEIRMTLSTRLAATISGLLLLAATPAFAEESDTCNIKGNVNTQGERIYHVPGQNYYDAAGINERAGERWFCSEAEARASGWRRSKR